MKRKLSLSTFTLALSFAAATALAADRSVPAGLPMLLPNSAATMNAPQMAPSVPKGVMMMAPKAAKPASIDAMIDGLSALKATRGGKQMEVPLPDSLRMMLKMPRQQGKITPKPSESKLTQINKTTDFPYTTMGLLGSGCTGTIVAKRFVITAAICIYDAKAKKFYDNLDFYPAINGNTQPYGAVKWKDAYIPKGYAENGDIQYDFGLVVLDSDIGDQTGWFGFGHVEKFDFKQLTLTGYPYDGVPGQTLWQTTCNIDSAEASFVFYRCPGQGKALAAMTGSPVWFKGAADDAWQIVAIHNFAQDDKKNSWWALRLSQATTETLLAWIDEASKTGTDTGGDQTTDEGGGTDQGTGDQTECKCDGG